jgi:nitroimidazol reductase NimA-like FMN-containing flavoprotein (pyridoxamine 5'-phosphate oxidase superfamily)
MRKANQEITDPKILEDILQKATIIRLAMIDNGMPYLLPFNFGYNENCIYIHSAPAGKKLEVLRRNPQVCFEVEDETATVKGDIACRWSAIYRSIIGYGKVEFVIGFDKKQQALDIIMQQHGAPANMEFDPKEVEFVVVLKLKIDSMTGKQSSNWNRLRGGEKG